MARAADILEGLETPAAVLSGAGRVVACNGLFTAAASADDIAGLGPGERLETARRGGGSWIWRAKALRGGRRLLIAEPGASGGLNARERYLAALSHELRTPLNGVLGMARLLEGTRLDADQKSYVSALRESGDLLLGLVNDVLDLAKLESGQLDLEPAPLDLERVLQGVCELLSPRAHEKGLEIAWAGPADLPPVMADDGRLRQILFNLAGNAVKFTESGGVLLTVAASPPGPDGQTRVRFTVSDTGPGVPEAEQQRIFEEFSRVSGPSARLEGAGLGLAIVRRLAAAHGGSVGLSARQGGGSAFWFEAPFPVAGPPPASASLAGLWVAVASPSPIVREAAALQITASGGRPLVGESLEAVAHAPAGAVLLIDQALKTLGRRPKPAPDRVCLVLLAPEERGQIARSRADGFAGYLIKPLRKGSLAERVLAVLGPAAAGAEAAPPEDERIAPAAGAGLRVLLAEDNRINALLARSLLEREGCVVDRAANGAEALEAAALCDYDLILMDVRMPEVDGLTATRTLRARGVSAPIIALTADAFEDDRRACLAAGMDDFLTKPLEPAALRALLARSAAADWTPARLKVNLAS